MDLETILLTRPNSPIPLSFFCLYLGLQVQPLGHAVFLCGGGDLAAARAALPSDQPRCLVDHGLGGTGSALWFDVWRRPDVFVFF